MSFHKTFTAETERSRGRAAVRLLEQALRGGRQDAFFDLLIAAADNVLASARLLCDVFTEFPDGQEKVEQIVEREHEGDRIAHEVIRKLDKEFVTPIDREDLLMLISALDDVVDLIDEAAAYLTLYRVEAPMVQAEALAHVLVDAASQLVQAVRLMARFEEITDYVVEVHRLENEGDRITRSAIASLFEDGIDPMVVIRWKDIFERLEDAIDSTERAAYVLEGVVIKNA